MCGSQTTKGHPSRWWTSFRIRTAPFSGRADAWECEGHYTAIGRSGCVRSARIRIPSRTPCRDAFESRARRVRLIKLSAFDARRPSASVFVLYVMTRDIDLLTSPALTHLRDRWWDASFTAFVRDTLRPQPGEHVLEVGCGAGIADLMLGLLEPGRVRYCGIDLKPARVREARGAARDHGLRLDLAVADVRGIPFRDATFESTFAIGVLQHVSDAPHAVAELARVTRPDGRVLLVEPDNANRYWFSSLDSGRRAFELSTQFFASRAKETPGNIDRALGPHLPRSAAPLASRHRHPSLPGDANPPGRARSHRLGRPPPRDRPRGRSRDGRRIPRAGPRPDRRDRPLRRRRRRRGRVLRRDSEHDALRSRRTPPRMKKTTTSRWHANARGIRHANTTER